MFLGSWSILPQLLLNGSRTMNDLSRSKHAMLVLVFHTPQVRGTRQFFYGQ